MLVSLCLTLLYDMKGLTWFEVRQRVNAWPGILRRGADDLKKTQRIKRKKFTSDAIKNTLFLPVYHLLCAFLEANTLEGS